MAHMHRTQHVATCVRTHARTQPLPPPEYGHVQHMTLLEHDNCHRSDRSTALGSLSLSPSVRVMPPFLLWPHKNKLHQTRAFPPPLFIRGRGKKRVAIVQQPPPVGKKERKRGSNYRLVNAPLMASDGESYLDAPSLSKRPIPGASLSPSGTNEP